MDDEVKNFREHHYDEMSKWFVARGMPAPPRWFLSSKGFIVPGLAAGFLYTTNSQVAFIDCYISNPDADSVPIREAIDAITRRIIQISRSHGVKLLCCSSKIRSIQKRARAFGFSDNGPHIGFSKEL